MEQTPSKQYQRKPPATEDFSGLAAETEATEPRLSAVLMNFESQYRQGTISTIVCFFFVIIGWPVIGMVFEKKSIVEEDDKPQGTLRAASEEYLIVNTDATQWNVLQFSRGSTTPFAIKYGSNSHPELVIKADNRVNQKADFSHEGSSTQFGRIKGFKGRVLALEAATNCVRAFVRTRCSRIAPTGRSWAAATTEGVFLYSIDDNFMFDPTCRLWFRSLKCGFSAERTIQGLLIKVSGVRETSFALHFASF
ncbi:hypothetical protein Tco_0647080 [Tanacetum coccineum]